MEVAGRMALLAAGIAAIGGCLFSTRDPEPPLVIDTSFRDPIDPDTVLRNIRVAFSDNLPNNYSRSLPDSSASFRFFPDPADAALVGEGFFDNWGKLEEERVFNEALARPDTIRLTWGPPIPNEIPDPEHPDDRYYRDLQYTVKVDSGGRDTAFSGRADLYMRRYLTQWKLVAWVDKRDGTANSTLGMVRANGKFWN